jgi:predicted ester cyclase
MKLWVQVILLSLLLGCAGKVKEKTNVAANSKDRSAEENKKINRHYLLDIINGRKLELLGEVFPEKFVRHDLNDGTDTRMTISDQHQRLSDLFQAFPDLQYTINDIVAEGDKVVVRTTWSGTQKDSFMKTESFGNSINGLSEIIFYRLENGKIVERWTKLDLHNLFKKMKGEK